MMENVKKLTVSLQFDENVIEVGELVSDSRRIYFKYFPIFVKLGLEISPFKLKLNNVVQRAGESPFDGLFGVFADSLPDGWGRLLLDRALTSKGIPLGEITPLYRLAVVGNNGMGALAYKPQMPMENAAPLKIELDEIAKATRQVLSGNAADVLDELFRLGGSSGGARPKILVGYNPMTGHLMGAERNLPPGYEHWLIKFPAQADKPDIAHIELAYHKMAKAAGLETSESKVFEGKAGRAYFGTKRFDRLGNNRFHLHSAAGMLHDNFRLSNLDYGHLMDCAFTLEKDVRAYEKVLRLAAFNVYAHNRDDHSKNTSFLMDAQGNWRLAPAYDLTFSQSNHGMHSTTVAGEGANPNKRHLMQLADYFKMRNAWNLIEEVRGVVHEWSRYAADCGVGRNSKSEIKKAIAVSDL